MRLRVKLNWYLIIESNKNKIVRWHVAVDYLDNKYTQIARNLESLLMRLMAMGEPILFAEIKLIFAIIQ